GDGQVFEVDARNPLAARLYHVLRAVGDVHEAVGVDGGHVASLKPAAGRELARLGRAKVVAGNERPAHQQVAKGDAVVRQRPAGFVHYLHIDAENAAALLDFEEELRIAGQVEVLAFERTHGAERRGFAHAPGVADFNTQFLIEGAQQRGRARRPAHYYLAQGRKAALSLPHKRQQPKPDGGHASRKRDFF
nr:hypothetical protein [Tanacetum cinerariifolium]